MADCKYPRAVWGAALRYPAPGANPGFRRGGGGFVQEFRLENRSYPDVHDFSLRMQVITCIANDYVAFDLRKVTIDLKILEFIVLL